MPGDGHRMTSTSTSVGGLPLLCAGMSLLLATSCAHGPPEAAPLRPTWERFQREVQCSERASYTQGLGLLPIQCQKVVLSALVDAYEDAKCVSDRDCAAMVAWPPMDPVHCCTAVGREWLSREAYRKYSDLLVDACGFVDAYCYAPCNPICVDQRCKIKGQDTLLPLSASELQCMEKGTPPPADSIHQRRSGAP